MKKLLCKIGVHSWRLKKETTSFATNISTWRCKKCGKIKTSYRHWGSNKEMKLK